MDRIRRAFGSEPEPEPIVEEDRTGIMNDVSFWRFFKIKIETYVGVFSLPMSQRSAGKHEFKRLDFSFYSELSFLWLLVYNFGFQIFQFSQLSGQSHALHCQFQRIRNSRLARQSDLDGLDNLLDGPRQTNQENVRTSAHFRHTHLLFGDCNDVCGRNCGTLR